MKIVSFFSRFFTLHQWSNLFRSDASRCESSMFVKIDSALIAFQETRKLSIWITVATSSLGKSDEIQFNHENQWIGNTEKTSWNLKTTEKKTTFDLSIVWIFFTKNELGIFSLFFLLSLKEKFWIKVSNRSRRIRRKANIRFYFDFCRHLMVANKALICLTMTMLIEDDENGNIRRQKRCCLINF